MTYFSKYISCGPVELFYGKLMVMVMKIMMGTVMVMVMVMMVPR